MTPLLDVSHAERLAAWAGGPVTLKIFERGDHNLVLELNRREYFLRWPGSSIKRRVKGKWRRVNWKACGRLPGFCIPGSES